MRPGTLEENIIEALKGGSASRNILVKKLEESLEVTAQGVYKALRSLQKKDIVTVHGKLVSLSLWWIDHELTRWNQIVQVYHANRRSNAFLDLRPGEYLKLRFRNLKELDLYWTHAYLILESDVNPKFSTYSIAPHDWFPYARPETDALWLRRQEKRSQRVVVTHPLPIDKKILAERRKQGVEVMLDANPFKQEEDEYKNLIHDWIFEAKLDETVNTSLIKWLKCEIPESDDQKKEMQDIINTKGKFTLKISRAPKRARSMTKKLVKYFE